MSDIPLKNADKAPILDTNEVGKNTEVVKKPLPSTEIPTPKQINYTQGNFEELLIIQNNQIISLLTKLVKGIDDIGYFISYLQKKEENG